MLRFMLCAWANVAPYAMTAGASKSPKVSGSGPASFASAEVLETATRLFRFSAVIAALENTPCGKTMTGA